MRKGRLTKFASLFFEFGPFDKHFRLGVTADCSFHDLARAIHLAVADFHLDVGGPRFLVRFPCAPSFEDLARSGDVAEHFLEVDVFVPDLSESGEERDGAVE